MKKGNIIKIKGSKKDGYIITVLDGRKYHDGYYTYDELVELSRLISKKVKK